MLMSNNTSQTVQYCVAIGGSALASNQASNNTAVGYQAGYSITTGIQNTSIGTESGRSVTTGSQNTFLGHGSGYYITTGSKNTIVGKYDGNYGGLDIRTSDNKVVVSDGDGVPAFHNDSTQWTVTGLGNVDITNNSSTTNVLAITANTGTLIFGGNSFSGVFIINDINTTGSAAICITGGGSLSIVGQPGATFVNSSSPGSDKIGVYMTGNTVTVKPNPSGGGTTNFRIMTFRTRTSS
jgi:hypothetical protein